MKVESISTNWCNSDLIKYSVTVNEKFILEEAMKAQRGVQVKLSSLFKTGTRWGWQVDAMAQPLYPQEGEPVPVLQEVGQAPGPVWTRVENLVACLGCITAPSSLQPVGQMINACIICVGKPLDRTTVQKNEVRSNTYMVCVTSQEWLLLSPSFDLSLSLHYYYFLTQMEECSQRESAV